MTAAMEWREAHLQALWRESNPGKPVPPEVERLRSWECVMGSKVVGHCAGDSATGEIIGLSVDPPFRGQGIARKLLASVVDTLRAEGATRIWVAAPADPAARAYGFYRAVGWAPTGGRASDGDEILEPTTRWRAR